ncbi:Protein-glutamate methylesterase/protein-glutamine glutaminase [Streptomyces alboniger]
MIRIVIAEDMHMVRGALVALLEMEPDLKVVAQFDSGDRLVPTALELLPDVAIVDIDLPGLDGLSAADQLRTAVPTCRVLILTEPRASRYLPAGHGCEGVRVPAEGRATGPTGRRGTEGGGGGPGDRPSNWRWRPGRSRRTRSRAARSR